LVTSLNVFLVSSTTTRNICDDHRHSHAALIPTQCLCSGLFRWESISTKLCKPHSCCSSITQQKYYLRTAILLPNGPGYAGAIVHCYQCSWGARVLCWLWSVVGEWRVHKGWMKEFSLVIIVFCQWLGCFPFPFVIILFHL